MLETKDSGTKTKNAFNRLMNTVIAGGKESMNFLMGPEITQTKTKRGNRWEPGERSKQKPWNKSFQMV